MKKDNNLIYGLRPVMEAIEAGQNVDKILLKAGLGGPLSGELKKLIFAHEIPSQYVPFQKLNKITGKNHQGVIAFLSPVPFQKIEDILPTLFEKGKTPLLLILDQITDVRNFGAILRTAECAGVDAVIIPEKGAAQVGPDAVKTSAGAVFNIPLCREKSMKDTVRFLQHSGLRVTVCTEKTPDTVYSSDFTGPTAIVMGSEDTGISQDLIKTADRLAKIPLMGKIGSLNVSVATGVILYEAVRQRVSTNE